MIETISPSLDLQIEHGATEEERMRFRTARRIIEEVRWLENMPQASPRKLDETAQRLAVHIFGEHTCTTAIHET